LLRNSRVEGQRLYRCPAVARKCRAQKAAPGLQICASGLSPAGLLGFTFLATNPWPVGKPSHSQFGPKPRHSGLGCRNPAPWLLDCPPHPCGSGYAPLRVHIRSWQTCPASQAGMPEQPKRFRAKMGIAGATRFALPKRGFRFMIGQLPVAVAKLLGPAALIFRSILGAVKGHSIHPGLLGPVGNIGFIIPSFSGKCDGVFRQILNNSPC